jgi:hypothetical protein
MASLIFNSFLDDLSKGNVKATDAFYGMLVTASYAPDKDAHTKRSDVTNEIAGTGYTAGGAATACTPTLDTSTDRENWTFADIAWAAATITNARAVVIYKHRGGASSADELVAYCDFGANESSTAATFTAHFISALVIQN